MHAWQESDRVPVNKVHHTDHTPGKQNKMGEHLNSSELLFCTTSIKE